MLVLTVTTGAAKAKFTPTWKAPGAQPTSFVGKKVVGLVISDDQALRMSTEEALARALTDRGVQGIAAYRLIPREELKDPNLAKGWFERASAAGVVLMRLIDLTKEKIPSAVVWSGEPTTIRSGPITRYAWGSAVAIRAGPHGRGRGRIAGTRCRQQQTAVGGDERESSNPAGAQQLVKDIVEAAADQMKKDGLIRK
jgi:hypothetical protein